MSTYLVQARKTRLSLPITSSDTSITLQGFYDLYGNALTMADFGTLGYGTIEPGSTDSQEIISFTGITNNGDGTFTLTGVVRGLKGVYPWTTGGTSYSHNGNVNFVISNNPQIYDRYLHKENGGTVSGLVTFSLSPVVPTPVSGTDAANKDYVNSVVAGIATTVNVVVPGTAGETVVAGNLVYFDDTDNEWKKCDADIASSVENTMLGIAQGSGVDGGAISGGVLVRGLDANQTGLTAGAIYYASNTAGGISASAGTTEVTIGFAYSTTQFYFNPRFNQQLTEDQQDALAGTSGTPSGSNKFVTNDDTTGNGTIARGSLVVNKFGGDGSDGALSISSGTTTIDLGNAATVVKNYTSISITGTGKLAFSNPNTNGTIIILKSQGSVTLTSSQTPMIDASGLGGAGGAAVSTSSNQTLAGLVGSAGFGFINSSGAGGAASSGGGGGGSAGAIASYQYKSRSVFTGYFQGYVGGGGGSGSTNGGVGAGTTTSGAGGAGGGTLIIECGGAWNFTTSSGISVAGVNGSNGSTSSSDDGAGGGGGGAGGYFLAMYKTLTANSGTVTVTGGTGGNRSANTAAVGGGGGGGSGESAGIAGTTSTSANAKTGGNGATGASLIVATT